MRSFSSHRDDSSLEPGDTINLLWRYEVSEDGGKTWYPEVDREDENSYVLRRGNWIAPPII
jgi:hypothetical protein